jgi:hypothetical protein
MKKAYYARPISVDNTPQEKRDHDLIRALGFEPYPIDEEKQAILARYREVGMEAFRPAVEASDALIFRAFPDGSIGAGVAQEIAWAVAAGVPVIGDFCTSPRHNAVQSGGRLDGDERQRDLLPAVSLAREVRHRSVRDGPREAAAHP